MDEEWAGRWRDAMRGDVRRLMDGFEQRFGYPPGEPEIAGPATEAELAGLRGDGVPADLLALYQVVAEVRIMDVSIGYAIHRPPPPGEDPGHPRRLSDGRRIVVFGSDGGGALFALPADAGRPVLRLADGACVDEVYDADAVTVVADDLAGFLSFLHDTTMSCLAKPPRRSPG